MVECSGLEERYAANTGVGGSNPPLSASYIVTPEDGTRKPWFLRIVVGGNSPRCIKTAAAEGHDYYRSLPAPVLDGVLPS